MAESRQESRSLDSQVSALSNTSCWPLRLQQPNKCLELHCLVCNQADLYHHSPNPQLFVETMEGWFCKTVEKHTTLWRQTEALFRLQSSPYPPSSQSQTHTHAESPVGLRNKMLNQSPDNSGNSLALMHLTPISKQS